MGKKTARLGIFKDVDTTAKDGFAAYCKARNIQQFNMIYDDRAAGLDFAAAIVSK